MVAAVTCCSSQQPVLKEVLLLGPHMISKPTAHVLSRSSVF